MDRTAHIAKCEGLYSVEKMLLKELSMQRTNYGVRIENYVHVPSTGDMLTLRGSYNRKNKHCPIKIGLYYKSSLPIRELHLHEGHHNPGGEEVSRAHKHYPTMQDVSECKWAYSVETLNQVDDFNDALLAFFEECNIVRPSSYQSILL
jgi:hypothetical protein